MTGETFKATIIAVLDDGTSIVNDYGYTDVGPSSTHIDTGTAAGNFQTLVQATYVAALPTNWAVYRYRFACVGGTHVGEIGFVDVSPKLHGALDPTNQLPAEMAISMKRQTGYATRRDRGRIFFGPVAVNFQQTSENWDQPADDSLLHAVRDLGKATLTTSTVVLKPVILAANGTYNGRQVIKASIGPTYVHRKSRRLRYAV